ncbi:MAG: oxidoreductase [Flaviaesturariibacter sp.]|nr:oxidoreductase [Flaviaesturariibacter sp.]
MQGLFLWGLFTFDAMYKFAIVGCGRIAARHAEQIAAVGKLVAVCDVVIEKANSFAEKFGANVYTSLDELLEMEKDVSIICVCTPNGLHAEHSIKSLQNGRHVLCEKPLCLTSSAAWSMMDTAHFFRRKLFIVKQNRYNEPVVFVKKLLEENKLGQILSFQINCFWNRPQQYYTGDWRGTKELDGGLLYTQFSHFIDLLYWFLGDIETVAAHAKNNGLREHFSIEDTGAVLLQMKNGALGTINYTVNSFEKNSEGSFAIFGEKGSVKIGGQYLNTIEWFHTEDKISYPEQEAGKPNDYGFYTGSMSNHHRVYEDLIKALENQKNNLPEIREAVKTVEMIEKIYKCSVD